MTRVDILMCTFRRPQVVDTIASLSRLRAPQGCALRLVVADNDETDSARASVIEAARGLPFEGIYQHAPSRNISVARNACLEIATAGRADWIASIDDDERADPDWLLELLAAATGSGADCAIGKVIADYPAETPHWVRQLDYHSSFPEREANPTADSGNSLIRWNGMPWQDQRYDVSRGTTGGEDTEFFLRLERMGMRKVAAPSAVTREEVPPVRQTLDWMALRRFRMGQTHVVHARSRQDKLLMLGSAGLKAAYCHLRARMSASDEVARNFWFLRGQLHRGVVNQLTTGAPQLQLYGQDPS
ncbi:glycosyltransferase [Paracoccus seriniphilus]|uniref:glycosyltransferase n=1 Tax=Paracoccus seriniphilus TaxID=184748 RepID=UPI003563518B